jgi:nitrogen regulatory protein P-II 1
MKEIKAYVYRNQIAEVIAAIKDSSIWKSPNRFHLVVHQTKGVIPPPDDQERHYSLELEDEVTDEYLIELICADEQADTLVEMIRSVAGSGEKKGGWKGGWVTVSNLSEAIVIT